MLKYFLLFITHFKTEIKLAPSEFIYYNKVLIEIVSLQIN